eukprot:312838_1
MAARKARHYTTCTFCDRKADSVHLYMCVTDDCEVYGEIYCERCGKIAHETRNHQFNTKSDHIRAVSLSIIKAHIKGGSTVAKQTLSTLEEHKTGELRRVYESSVIASFVGGLTGNVVKNLPSAHDVTNASLKILKGAKNIHTSVLLGSAADLTTDVLKHALPGAAVGAGIMFGFEVVVHGYRYMNGEMGTGRKALKELAYHISKGFVASASMGLCNWGGTAVGATIGTLVGGPVGTIIGGIVGGLISGVIGAKIGRCIFDQIWPEDFLLDDQRERNAMIKKALNLFGILNFEDMKNHQIFNQKRLEKKYKELAKIYHPDKNGGSPESHAKFAEIGVSLGILLSLLEKNDKRKVVKRLTEVKEIAWKYDIKKLRRILETEGLMEIAYMFNAWNPQYTIEYLAEMRVQDILVVVDEMNQTTDFPYSISNMKKQRFAKVIQSWRDWNNGGDLMQAFNANNPSEDDNPNENDEQEEKKYEDEYDGIEIDDLFDLKDDLRKKNLFYIVDLCEKLDPYCSLDALLQYRRNDILEVLDEINDNEAIIANKKKISAREKNKFAAAITKFSELQAEQCISK